MEHNFFSKALVKEYRERMYGVDKEMNLPMEILSFGISTGDRVLHIGCCDKGINLINTLEHLKLETLYLGIDVKDEIKLLEEKYKDIPTYAFKQKSIQHLIDEELYEYSTGDIFEYTVITGLFDKPVYEERHYEFIASIVERCMLFSDKVIFSINSENYSNYSYSILYVMNILLTANEYVTIKKLKKNNYIFCITH